MGTIAMHLLNPMSCYLKLILWFYDMKQMITTKMLQHFV
ncbi:hypothetical protein CIN_02970 [Commensalibacter intestini A911]|uniref:Uncharacterized protein n=1 Tax=Commensalibacter intestini A911 TaxID=1088868 RepID=G6EXX7_9PROT|nr:hypothetical protein CIN_02970 [Commensalibacter intestini A911]